jgi:glutamate/tyrosine decarboxylase-like PLP-dependent enzyme
VIFQTHPVRTLRSWHEQHPFIMTSIHTALYPGSFEQHGARIARLRQELQKEELPERGIADSEQRLQEIAAAIPRQAEPTYLAFVTGGVTHAAARADNLVTELDASPQTHISDMSIATNVEDAALRWLLQLYGLDPSDWKHRTTTTGATASHIVGLACGRDYVVGLAASKVGLDVSVGQNGLAAALKRLEVDGIRILTSMGHSSLGKAASIIGLGRDSVVDLTDSSCRPRLDMARLETELKDNRFLYIVGISCGEVNTGRFATNGEMMKAIRDLCDAHGAWLHVDAGRLPMTMQLHQSWTH